MGDLTIEEYAKIESVSVEWKWLLTGGVLERRSVPLRGNSKQQQQQQ